MDEWTFPVGTKIWKQFAFGGKNVETRYLFKRGNSDWVYTTYQWSADQTTATELTTGATDVGGTGYEIPYLDECRTCHMGRLDFVLGFEAVALSTPQASGLTMATLVAAGWVTDAPGSPIVIPGDATTSAALGWLHANCGTACHNASNYALAGSTGFFMRLDVADLATVETTATYTTGVNVPAMYVPPDGGTLMRIAPGDPAGSCVVFRAGYRDTEGERIQMPPDDTHVVDAADLAVVASWITSRARSPCPRTGKATDLHASKPARHLCAQCRNASDESLRIRNSYSGTASAMTWSRRVHEVAAPPRETKRHVTLHHGQRQHAGPQRRRRARRALLAGASPDAGRAHP